ncbi:MAG: ACP phosphodiesterase [Desulfuromonadales bacterium]|nr:ACP phosphodiesterase [Desulfuromonadales bacterium]
MNILFHLYLSGSDPELLVGNFMGDFVKGPLDDTYPPRIRQGLLLHRKIDAFAQRDLHFQRSRLRLPPHYGLYRGVLIDLFYDHFLASEWTSWSAVPFADYLVWAQQLVEKERTILPPRLQELVAPIFNEILPSYQRVAGTELALRRMARRLRRANPLAEGGGELTRHYAGLQEDFAGFTLAVQKFSADLIASMDENSPHLPRD